jgi:hypothetical protein
MGWSAENSWKACVLVRPRVLPGKQKCSTHLYKGIKNQIMLQWIGHFASKPYTQQICIASRLTGRSPWSPWSPFVDRYPAMCLLCFQNPASMDLESRKVGTHRYSAVTSSSLSGQLNFFVMSWKSSRLAWIFAWHSGKIVVHSPWNKVKALCNFCLRLRKYPCCKESPDISYRKANSLWSHSSNTVQVAWLLMNGVINY